MSPRADARRNVDALLAAAKEEFAMNGVDVGVRAIAARAGVGTATLYRHFPARSDLVAAVFRREIDACAAEAAVLAAEHPPAEALERWLLRFTEFVATKQGLAAALHSGDPAFAALPAYFTENLGPQLQVLLESAQDAGDIQFAADPVDLLGSVANLCIAPPGSSDPDRPRRMVGLLVDGMRFRAAQSGQDARYDSPARR